MKPNGRHLPRGISLARYRRKNRGGVLVYELKICIGMLGHGQPINRTVYVGTSKTITDAILNRAVRRAKGILRDSR